MINVTNIDMEKKYRFTITFILLIFLLLAVATIFINGIKKEHQEEAINIVLNEGKLIINYIDGDSVYINDKKEHQYHISITNNDSKNTYYSLEMIDLNGSKITAKLYDEEGNDLLTIEDVTENSKILSLMTIEPKQTIRYTLELISTKKNQFSGTIRVVNDSITTQTFSDLILLKNNINTSKTNVGKETATIEEGLLTSVDDDGISYFFRGAVDNNYLKINNMYFRIVRINGDGSVRVILDDVLPNVVAFNTNQLPENTEPGTLVNLKDSTIATTLNDWFNTNLSSYGENFINGKFCSETTFPNLNNGLNRSNAYNRIFALDEPSLSCTGTVNELKVGLLSSDEAVLAGAYRSTENKDYYLYNSSIVGSYFLTSPNFISSDNVVSMLTLASNGAIAEGTLITDTAYVRPVLNVGVSAKVKGEGTYENPYIIVS